MLLRQTSIYGIARIATAAISFALIPFFTRIMSPDEFGIYTYALAMITLFHHAAMGWIGMGALRLSEREGQKERILNALLMCIAAVSGISIFIGLIVIFTFEGWPQKLLMITCLAFFLSQGWLETNLAIMRARLQVTQYALYTVGRTVVASFFGAWFAWIGWGAQGILLGGLLGVVFASLPLSYQVWARHPAALASREDVWLLLRYGGPLAVSFTVGAIIMVTDRFLIEMLIGIYALGIYGAAFQIADRIMRTLTVPLGNAALPLAISKLETSGREAANEQLRNNWLLLILVSLPAFLGLWAVTPNLMELAVGDQYREGATQIVPIIAFATLLNGLRINYFDHAFHLGEKTQLLLIQSGTVASVNFVASIWLILEFGIIGAAYGTVVAQGVGVTSAALLGRLSFKLPMPVTDTSKIVLASAAMFFALYAVPFPDSAVIALLLQTLAGASIYAICVFALNPFNLRQQTIEIVKMRVQQLS